MQEKYEYHWSEFWFFLDEAHSEDEIPSKTLKIIDTNIWKKYEKIPSICKT